MSRTEVRQIEAETHKQADETRTIKEQEERALEEALLLATVLRHGACASEAASLLRRGEGAL